MRGNTIQTVNPTFALKNGGFIMGGYIADLSMVAILIIGITALMGVITNGFGEKVLGGKKRSEFVDQSARFQKQWKKVGGKKK
jgi:hypothetical protein